MNLKLPKVYWAVSAGLILSGIVCMTAGAVRTESDRKNNLIRQAETFENISAFDIFLTEGAVFLEKDAGITECMVEITSISDTVEMNSQDGKLQIQDKRKQILHFFDLGFLHPVSTEIKITVPEQEYQQAIIKIDAGSCSVSGLQMEELWIDSDVGDCKITDCKLKALKLETDTGDTELKNNSIQESCILDSDIGECKITDCEIKALKLETGTGDTELKNNNIQGSCILDSDIGAVYAEDLSCSGKTEINLGTGDCQIENAAFSGDVQAENDIGAMSLQNITVDGSLHLAVDTGDVSVSVNGREEDFALECFADIGSVSLNHKEIGNVRNSISNTDHRNKMIISTDVGSIDLYFLKEE